MRGATATTISTRFAVLALQPVTDRPTPTMAARSLEFLRAAANTGRDSGSQRGITDAQGNVDTSFLARIPADVPFTFQTLDRNGLVLNMAQTWHQARPGEKRYDCGGCHAHSKPALDFHTTAADRSDYVDSRSCACYTSASGRRFSRAPGYHCSVRLDFGRIPPRHQTDISRRSALRVTASRNGLTPAAGLDLDADDRLIEGIYPATYAFLARQRSQANPTHRSITPEGNWYWPQVTRYIRAGQSRQSLLAWKVFGKRLDGRPTPNGLQKPFPGIAQRFQAGSITPSATSTIQAEAMPPAELGADAYLG